MNIYQDEANALIFQQPIDVNKFNNGEYEFVDGTLVLKDMEHELKSFIIETQQSFPNVYQIYQ